MKYLLVLLLLCVPLFYSCGQKVEAHEKPNIVFILADDCTSWDIGVYGNKDSKTPTIDELASEGMLFEKCYQSAPMCSPTRQNILTGLYPTVSGAYPNHTNVNSNVKSIANYLKPLGYRVALSGKQHYGPDENFPIEFLGKGKSLDPDFEYVDTFLKETTKGKKPFCLFLMSNQPHTPWNKGDRTLFDKDKVKLPPIYADTPETRNDYVAYLAEINYLDGQVKQALDVLDKYDLADNTIVVFASEQGNAFPFAKWTCYNAGVKSALIVRWPGKVKAGSVSNALVEYSDITPTFIDLAGGNKVDGLDGSSLVPVLTNQAQDHKKYTYAQMTTKGINNGSEYYPIRSISNGKYRYIRNLTPEMKFSNWVFGTPFFKEWKEDAKTNEKTASLINKYTTRPPEELYDDENDPYNQNNLIEDGQYSKIKEELKNQLKKWMDKKGDEGIKTELLAFQHMPGKASDYEVIVDEKLHEPTSNNESDIITVTKKGYYSFYLKGKETIKVDNIEIVAENSEAKITDQRYGIIGLKKGKHTIQTNAKEVFWRGPEMKKQKIKLN